MPICAACLGTTGNTDYHENCLELLFGTRTLPALDIELSKLYALAAKMAGKMSISGVQEKVSLRLSPDGTELQVAATAGTYILKPESARFSYLPQNEHLTMRLATLVGIDTPPLGLVRLKDGSVAYLIKRFDRLDDGGKLPVEDFCQLSEKPLRDKYNGSAELCARLLRKYASEPLIEIRKLYRILLFSWWVANGDQHLKNFSLIILPDGLRCLAPAYDLVCTRLVLPDDKELALPVGGKKRNLTQRSWLDFATYCGIPARAAKRLLDEQIEILRPAIDLIHRSFLPEDLKRQYESIVRETTAVLSSGHAPSLD